MFEIWEDSPEYKKRKSTPFTPPKVTLREIHASIPKHLFHKSTVKGIFYLSRDVSCALLAFKLATFIDPLSQLLVHEYGCHNIFAKFIQFSLWSTYWFWQGIILAGWWCLGHEAGHGTLSTYGWVNALIGYVLHTALLSPYYSWRSTHHAHHKATCSVERDENYVPRTREDYGLPDASTAKESDYSDVFEDAPLYILLRMLVMQVVGWHYYLLRNAMGSHKYPPGTNHFSPSSPLFKSHERSRIILSNVGLLVMSTILASFSFHYGITNFIKYYFIPYILVNHWIVMLTYLHHSDPTIPYYRAKEWSFLRGCLATTDRPLLGWIGRFFLHNVSHDHIAHHLFSSIPFYNQPQVTEHLKLLLGADYNYDSTNSFRALYRTFTECCFIENEGEIAFYKNKYGVAGRRLTSSVANVLRLPQRIALKA